MGEQLRRALHIIPWRNIDSNNRGINYMERRKMKGGDISDIFHDDDYVIQLMRCEIALFGEYVHNSLISDHILRSIVYLAVPTDR
ncbi:hypothetical protein BLOT_006705 [Blomia tropicalis]|nr:hypothetical protein BLOT_006705 [Blomia tropicalis]